MKFLVVLLVLGVVLVNEGYGFQCLVSQCTTVNGKSTVCPMSVVKACPEGHNRCMTMSTKMTQGGMVIITEINNCTIAVACSDNIKNETCKGIRDIGGSCDMKCCEGDLCNTNSTTDVVVGPSVPSEKTKGPKGANLTCYVCQTGYEKDSNDTSLVGGSCEKPPKRTCSDATNPYQPVDDRCATVKYQQKDAKTGNIRDVELRNCSQIGCDWLCKHFNQTGDLVSCNVKCCEGNLCNSDVIPTTPSPPKAGQNACALINIMTIIVAVLVSMYC